MEAPLAASATNSGYLEAMKKIVAEQLAYGVDGFHIDMLDQGFGKPYGCWCETCRKLFKDRYGHEMPNGATWGQRLGRHAAVPLRHERAL